MGAGVPSSNAKRWECSEIVTVAPVRRLVRCLSPHVAWGAIFLRVNPPYIWPLWLSVAATPEKPGRMSATVPVTRPLGRKSKTRWLNRTYMVAECRLPWVSS